MKNVHMNMNYNIPQAPKIGCDLEAPGTPKKNFSRTFWDIQEEIGTIL